MKAFLRFIINLFKCENESKFEGFEEDIEFLNKVKKVMKKEKDFSPFLDKNMVYRLSEDDKMRCVADLTIKYINAKAKILNMQ